MTDSQLTSIAVLVLLTPDLSKRFRSILCFGLVAYQTICLIGEIGRHLT